MNYYKTTIQYDGTNYFGFQWQKDIPTIQNDFNQSIKLIMGGKITTMGASRTDSGVHALEQIVKITSEHSLEDDFLTKLNLVLPPQIKCLSITPCKGPFKPASDSTSKEYRYLFTNHHKASCTDQRFIANNPYVLNLSLMKRCAKEIEGTHDFHNFCSTGSNVKSTIRNITSCELLEIEPHTFFPRSDLFQIPHDLGQCYQLKIKGNGFLKQMVRHLMSALWLVGGGKISPEEFSLLLKGPKKTRRLWKVASPRGLYLCRIEYGSKGSDCSP